MLKLKLIFIPLWSLLLLVTGWQVCKAEPFYTVSKSELTTMKHYLTLIRQENQNLISDLQNCKISLQQAEALRLNLENQLNGLLNEHKALLEAHDELATLLKELQESFVLLKKEAATKLRRLAIQRNIGLVLGVVAFLL